MLDKKQIETMIMLKKYRNVSLAAEHLFTSQPSLSRYLKKIENEFGYKIYSRAHSPMTLTEEGEIYYRYLDKFLDIENEMISELDLLNNNNQLRLSGLPFISTFILPNFVPLFLKDNPERSIIINDYSESDYEELIMNGKLDIFFSNYKPKNPALGYKSIKKDDVYLLCRADGVPFGQEASVNKLPHIKEISSFEGFEDKTFYLQPKYRNLGLVSSKILDDFKFTPKKIEYIPNLISGVSMINDSESATFITQSSFSYIKLKDDFAIFKPVSDDDYLSLGFAYNKKLTESYIQSIEKALTMALANN